MRVYQDLRERCNELVEQHGGIRAAARVLRIDHSYFCKLADSTKVNPSDAVLRRMGLRRVVTYEALRASDSDVKR